MVVLAVLVACSGPAPEQPAAAPGDAESMAAPEASPSSAPGETLAGEGFESGRSETLEPAETH